MPLAKLIHTHCTQKLHGGGLTCGICGLESGCLGSPSDQTVVSLGRGWGARDTQRKYG